MVEEIVYRINDIIQFLESSVQRGYSSYAEESPLMSVVWDFDWMSNDFEVEGFDTDDDDWDGMNCDDNDCDSYLCMH
jgi:hypothetical protein